MHQVATSTTAIFVLFTPVRGGPSGRDEMTFQMHGDDGIPLILGHIDERSVAQDASIVYEDVEVPEGIYRRADKTTAAVPIGHIVTVADGLAAPLANVRHDLLDRGEIGAGHVAASAEVVYDDLGALCREEDGMLPPDAPACAGNDRDAPVQCPHGLPLIRCVKAE